MCIRDRVEDYGQLTLDDGEIRIHLLNIIGEIEGHECLPSNSKTTKYEHVIPQLAALEDSRRVQGLLVLINTVGGDVESGLAIAELIASLSKPTVSLVLGGSHSIGVPLAVSTDYSLIVPTGTMMIHPVRMNGLIIGCLLYTSFRTRRRGWMRSVRRQSFRGLSWKGCLRILREQTKRIRLMQTDSSVSYTHLDVYKRQPIMCFIGRRYGTTAWNRTATISRCSISFTIRTNLIPFCLDLPVRALSM